MSVFAQAVRESARQFHPRRVRDVGSLEKARRADGKVPLPFSSEDTAANEEREKIIKEFYRRVRFSANDRSVPASDQQ